jgi:hypothetical protein
VKIEKDVFDDDWDEVLAKYELGKQLGSGAFAVVKHVTEKRTGKVFAMKVCPHCRACLGAVSSSTALRLLLRVWMRDIPCLSVCDPQHHLCPRLHLSLLRACAQGRCCRPNNNIMNNINNNNSNNNNNNNDRQNQNPPALYALRTQTYAIRVVRW